MSSAGEREPSTEDLLGRIEAMFPTTVDMTR
jgi:hypothetical protein